MICVKANILNIFNFVKVSEVVLGMIADEKRKKKENNNNNNMTRDSSNLHKQVSLPEIFEFGILE